MGRERYPGVCCCRVCGGGTATAHCHGCYSHGCYSHDCYCHGCYCLSWLLQPQLLLPWLLLPVMAAIRPTSAAPAFVAVVACHHASQATSCPTPRPHALGSSHPCTPAEASRQRGPARGRRLGSHTHTACTRVQTQVRDEGVGL